MTITALVIALGGLLAVAGSPWAGVGVVAFFLVIQMLAGFASDESE